MEKSSELIVSVDLGTTTSGVAWQLRATAQRGIDPRIVTDWPDAPGQNEALKVPSEVSYQPVADGEWLSGDADKLIGGKRNLNPIDCQWGYSIESDRQRVRCFKLMLPRNNEKMPEFVSREETVGQMTRHGRKGQQVATDYLKKILDHAMDVIEKEVGTSPHGMTKDFIISVPASWSPEARDATRKAFRGTGYGEAYLVSEPEAAAHHAIAVNQFTLQKNDVIMVIDAGGGTVDLVSYYIASQSPLELVIAAPGDAAICGSALLNGACEAYMREEIGSEKLEYIMRNHLQAFNELMHRFDSHSKRSVTETAPIAFQLPLPGVQHPKVKDGFFKLPASAVRDFFEPNIKKILSLIYKQAENVQKICPGKLISHLVLVGGFGSSNYLYSQLKKRIDLKKIGNEAVQIIRSRDAWSAVSLGAVRCALTPGTITGRIVGLHYGFTVTELDDDSEDDRRRSVSTNDGTKCHYIFHKGDLLKLGKVCSKDLIIHGTEIDVELITCSGKTAKRTKMGRDPIDVVETLNCDLQDASTDRTKAKPKDRKRGTKRKAVPDTSKVSFSMHIKRDGPDDYVVFDVKDAEGSSLGETAVKFTAWSDEHGKAYK